MAAEILSSRMTSVTYSSLALPDAAVAHLHRRRAGVLALDDPHHPAGAHGGVAVHLQNGQEQFVQLIPRDRLAGYHLDLALDRGVHHDGGAGRLRHELDQFLDIGLLEVDREILGHYSARPQCRRANAAASRALRVDRFTTFT